MVMELLVGKRLDEAIQEKQALDLPEVTRIGVQLCEALSTAHKKGIIHRDLKPANVMLVPQEGGTHAAPKVKVMDFGLAKIIDEADSSRSLTETGLTIGTPAYMSPEQCLGQRVDARTDVYAIGCILYEAISGKKAFDGKSFLETMNAHLQTTPKRFTQPNSTEAERSLESILLKAMEQDRDARYHSVDELLSDLTKLHHQQKVVVARNRRKTKTGGLNRVLIGTACGAMLAGAAYLFWSSTQTTQAPQPAQELKAHRVDTYGGKTLAQLTQAIEANPDEPENYFNRAYLHMLRDERDSAIEDFTQAIKLDPTYARAYDRRAEMYVMISQFDKALADANAEIKLSPDRWYGWSERARINLVTERYADALSDAKRSLQIEFSESTASTLAMIYAELGDFGGAMQCIERCFQASNATNDDRYWNHYNRAMVYLKARDYNKAIEDFRAALSNHHLMSQAWGDMATAYGGIGDMKNAEEAIRNTVSLDSFPARAYRLKGEMYRAAGKWSEAAQEYSTSTSLEPWFGPGFEQRAYAEIAMGQMTTAYADLQRAATLMPFSARILSALAMVEDQIGKNTDAKKHMDQALAMKPDTPPVFLQRARISMHAGDFAAAITDLNRAIELNPRLADAYAARATALRQLNRIADADADNKTAGQLWYHAPEKPLKIAPVSSIVGGATAPAPTRPPIAITSRADAVPTETVTNEQLVALGASDIWINLYMGTGALGSDKMLSNWNPSASTKKFSLYMLHSWANNKEDLDRNLNQLARPSDDKSLAALNHVRYIALCRLAYMAGWMTEKEAWAKILPIVRSIRNQFDSWNDLAERYADGRLRQLQPDDQDKFLKIMHEYLNDPTSPPKTVRFKN